MSVTGAKRGLPRICAAALLLCLAAPVAAQEAAPQVAGPVEIEESFAVALVRDVMAAVNHGNWTGNYTVLRDYADTGFAAANDPTRLAALFAPLREGRVDLLPTLVTDPVILRSEARPDGAEMQLTGYFPMEPEHVSFDLLMRREGNRWWVRGISVGTFEPISD